MNHTGLGTFAWTQRLKPHHKVYTANQAQCLVIWRLAAVAVCCIQTFLQCLLSARLALPSRLHGDPILGPRRSGRSASTRWVQAPRTRVGRELRMSWNKAAGAARRKVAGCASPCTVISCPLPRRTKGTRRLRDTAQIAFHFLLIGLHVGVAAPTLREVQRSSLFPSSQLCGVEHVCRPQTVAVAALIQTLLPSVFLSISHTLRQLGRASLAFRILCDIPVPSPHLHAARVKRRACQCFATETTLHFGVVVGGVRPVNSGPTSFEAMCCTCRTSTPLYTTLFYSGTEECGKWG